MKPNPIRYGGILIAVLFIMGHLDALALKYAGFLIPRPTIIVLPLMLAAAREGQIAARKGAPAPDMAALLRAAGICTAVYALVMACFILFLSLSFGEAFTPPGAGSSGFILIVAFVINASFLSVGYKTESKKLAKKAGK